ncbi:protein RER1-like protein [Perkinsela sp. CCAP 1560/4]|nr:protein RER1-like protein [Perkinsela sp. CCAP 1560/4]|eukprot:KNH06321.1 protein RER1-like protein [Perkinsela sp. CCAP 1560/4]
MNDFDEIGVYQPKFEKYVSRAKVIAQRVLERLIPHVWPRWTAFALFIVFFICRIYSTGGFFIVAYGLAIYLLNLGLIFLTPATNFEDGEESLENVPSSMHDFKPFLRQLPEFKMWKMGMLAVVCATVPTFFSFLDIPCYWPILVMYFFLLMAITMKQRIQHMIDYRYVPWSRKKKSYVAK